LRISSEEEEEAVTRQHVQIGVKQDREGDTEGNRCFPGVPLSPNTDVAGGLPDLQGPSSPTLTAAAEGSLYGIQLEPHDSDEGRLPDLEVASTPSFAADRQNSLPDPEGRLSPYADLEGETTPTLSADPEGSLSDRHGRSSPQTDVEGGHSSAHGCHDHEVNIPQGMVELPVPNRFLHTEEVIKLLKEADDGKRILNLTTTLHFYFTLNISPYSKFALVEEMSLTSL